MPTIDDIRAQLPERDRLQFDADMRRTGAAAIVEFEGALRCEPLCWAGWREVRK